MKDPRLAVKAQAEFVGMTIKKRKQENQAKVSPVSSSTHSHSHLLPHSQVPKPLQFMPAGSGVLKGFHAANWLCLWTLLYLGKVIQKVVLHHLAEGCARVLEKFLPGEQPFFSIAQSSSPTPHKDGKQAIVKPHTLNPSYPRAGIVKQTFLCLGILV